MPKNNQKSWHFVVSDNSFYINFLNVFNVCKLLHAQNMEMYQQTIKMQWWRILLLIFKQFKLKTVINFKSKS